MAQRGGVQPHEHRPTELTKAKVEGFSCAGFTQEQIAKYLEIDVDTLVKHYRAELHNAKLDKISQISGNVYKKALEGDEKMMEFVLKCQGRWSYAKAPEESKKDEAITALTQILVANRDKILNGS